MRASAIDPGAVEERFVRASGPGGQNVNKVATAVELRFDVPAARGLDDAVKARLLKLAGARATKTGVIVIEAGRFRTQDRNRQDARDRLEALIARAKVAPKRRTQTKTPKAEKRRRREDKARRSVVKAGRGAVRGDD